MAEFKKKLTTTNNNNITSGFTLIEWLVSFSITLILILLVFQFSAQFCSYFVEQSKINQVCLENHAALYHMMKKISQAPYEKNKWEKISGKEILWPTHAQQDAQKNNITHVGYRWNKDTLYFVAKKLGKKRGQSVLTKNIKSVNFLLNYKKNNEIKSVTCNIEYFFKDKSFTLSHEVMLQNRSYYYEDK